MGYIIEIIRESQHKTSEWSGGITNELYIYPKGAIYGERNFKWRLSSAKVEAEESTFTPLSGIYRIIMIIEGKLQLQHKGHHNATLNAFDQDSFEGDWATKSFGKVTDFNLMMTPECSGKLEVISVSGGQCKDILLHNNMGKEEKSFLITEAFYLVEGELEIITEIYEKTRLYKGDLALITRTDKDHASELKLWNCVDEESKIIRSSILYLE